MYFLKKINLNNYEFWCEVVPAAEIPIKSLNPTNIYHYLQFDVLSLLYSILRGSVGGVISNGLSVQIRLEPAQILDAHFFARETFTVSQADTTIKYQWYILESHVKEKSRACKE